MTKRLWWKVGAIVACVAVLVVASVSVGLPSETSLRATFAQSGFWGYILFAALYSAFVLLPVPKNVFSIAAGAVFGFGAGLAVVMAGALAGSLVAFAIGRLLGRDVASQLGSTHIERVDTLAERRGFVGVLALRLIPLVPFTTLNYLAGATALRVRDYGLGTVFGIVPGAAAYVALGAYGQKPASVPFVSAIVGLIVLSVVGFLAVRRRRQ